MGGQAHSHSHGHGHSHSHGDSHAHGHHELGFWRKYVFSVDHKVIGIQYGITALVFLLLGLCLMLIMRWQLAFPGSAPFWGLIPPLRGEVYNSFGAMHGTIMVFLGVVPMLVGAFGNYVMPLQIGATDMAFPKLNMMSYWVFFVGGVVMVASFFVHEGAAKSGWTSYAPLSIITDRAGEHPTLMQALLTGQTMWLIGMVFLITSSLLGSVNFIVTISQLRAKGMTLYRMPFFVWAQFVTAFLLLLAFPPLEAAGVLQLMDRLAGTSFFMPSGLVVSGELQKNAGSGNPVLWQHLFWFLAHPEVYVLVLPAFGMVGEVIANNTRKALWGYRLLVHSIIGLGFLSFIVWAHHMFMTGMGDKISTFFAITTMLISIPSVIILTCLILSLYGSCIRYTVPMLFAVAFLPMFAIGGLTGLPLGLPASDIHLHDTYYVIAHFHYVVAPGTIFAIFAGIYYWFPKVTGRKLNDLLGRLHFFLSFIFMNAVFLPMFIYGMMGGLRRGFETGSQAYDITQAGRLLIQFSSFGAWGLGLAQIPFIVNFFKSIRGGQKVSDNPWEATTMEWLAPSPPPHGNFTVEPVAYRGPYDYSPAGSKADFFPQYLAKEA